MDQTVVGSKDQEVFDDTDKKQNGNTEKQTVD